MFHPSTLPHQAKLFLVLSSARDRINAMSANVVESFNVYIVTGRTCSQVSNPVHMEQRGGGIRLHQRRHKEAAGPGIQQVAQGFHEP